MRAKTRLTATILVFVLSAACRSAPKPESASQPKHVLVITIDTLRADHLGSYGYNFARTPRLDQLAREGVRVEHAVSVAPITLPSHTSIFTGLYPPAHGVRDNGAYRVPEKLLTLAEILQEKGYSTQAIVSAQVLHRRYNLDQGFDGYDDKLWNEDQPGMFMIRERPARRTVDTAIEWLRTWSGPSEEQRKPFFLWVHLFDPHQPHDAGGADKALSVTPYDAEIAAADRQVGRLLDALAAEGVLDDTLVVFTSDHGESLGEHGEQTHAVFIYESTIRVPMIFRHPSTLPADTVYRGDARGVDVFPTVLSMLGHPIPSNQGFDLSGALKGRAEGPGKPQYSESLLAQLGFGMAPLLGVRNGPWTYIRAPRPELYDRAADPRELSNLLSTGATEATRKAAELDGELDRILLASERFGITAIASPLDEETTEMLQALGYLGEAGTREAVQDMDPKDGIKIYSMLEHGRHLARDLRFEEAKATLEALLEIVPGHVSARNTLALCESRLGNRDKAIEHHLRSLADEPHQPRVMSALADIYLQRGELDLAEAKLKEALQLNPDFVEAILARGFLELKRKRPKEAERWYNKALETDADYPRAYLQYGALYFRQGESIEARHWYERAIEKWPDNFQAVFQAGVCSHRLREHEKAEAYFKRALEIRPDAWEPYYNLACSRALQSDLDGSLAYLGEATDKGFDDARLLKADSDLASLHADARFIALEKKLIAARGQK
jgi:choline-sulfatase